MANYDPHPSYPQPTIREAICELRFPGDPLQFPAQFSNFWSLSQPDYSSLETHIDQLVNVPAPFDQPTSPLPPTRLRFLLRHSLRSVIVQAVAGAVTLNVPAPYLGWQTMEQDITDVWQMAIAAFQPSQVTGLTLRYIDAVPQAEHLLGAEGWLQPGDYVPAAIFQQKPPFTTFVQTSREPEGNISVSIGYERGSITPPATLLVDFNRSINSAIETGIESVRERVNDMHEDIWHLFSSMKGPRWEQILKDGD